MTLEIVKKVMQRTSTFHDSILVQPKSTAAMYNLHIFIATLALGELACPIRILSILG